MDSGRTAKRQFLWLAVSIGMAAFICRLDGSVVNISLPVIAHYFKVGTSVVSWVMQAYFLSLTVTLLIFGKLADIVGARRLFLWGYGIFVGSSLLCGLSNHIGVLIGARCLQGMGASMLIIAAFALIPRFIPHSIEGWAFGILATAMSLGSTAGAPLGGFITALLSWRGVFLVNLPLGILAILLAAQKIPSSPASESNQASTRFDFGGAFMSGLGLFCLLYALNLGQEFGWMSPLIISCFIGFALLTVAFIFREKSIPEPLVDLGLFANRRFTLYCLSGTAVLAVMSGTSFLIPFNLELARHLSTWQSGLVMMGFSVSLALVSTFAGSLSDRIKPSLLCTLALFLATAACLFYSFTLSWPGLFPTLLFLCWLGAALGLFVSPNNSQIMQMAPVEQPGGVSGVWNTMGNAGLVMGVCLFETVFSHFQPAGVVMKAHAAAPGGMASMSIGFQAAFLLGALLCAGSLLLTLWGGKTGGEQSPIQG